MLTAVVDNIKAAMEGRPVANVVNDADALVRRR
jgi:hypothetical protein